MYAKIKVPWRWELVDCYGSWFHVRNSNVRLSNTMQQLHIKNIFQLFIPLGGGDAGGFAFTQTTTPSFGLTLTKQDTNEGCHYQLELITIDENGKESKSEGLAWAKRSPYRFQTKENSSLIEGVIFQCKVVPGVFDFRRVKQRLIRFQVNCFSSGVLLSQASSAIYQLLPKRRVADEEAEDEGKSNNFISIYDHHLPGAHCGSNYFLTHFAYNNCNKQLLFLWRGFKMK